MSLTYATPTASLPDATFSWSDNSGNPIDFSSGWTFRVTIAQPPNSAQVVKTTGITGNNSLPNLTVAWDANELAVLTPGRWSLEIVATYTANGKSMTMLGTLTISGRDIN